jgi:phosphoglycolate phosphatase
MTLVVFDLDGTLVDSLEQISVSMNMARIAFGFEPLEIGRYRELLGKPVGDLFEDLMLSEEASAQLIIEFRKILLREIQDQNKVFGGVVPGLRLLAECGARFAIATSKPSDLAKQVVYNSELRDFDFFVRGTDDEPHKPDPFVILECLRHFDRPNAVMIGDRTEDMEAAFSAGVPGVGIAASGHTTTQLKKSGAHTVFQSFEDLTRTISNVNDPLAYLLRGEASKTKSLGEGL